jgi:hypothetical protein
MASIAPCAPHDVLPTELLFLILSYLLPHQLTGFALSCRYALTLSDRSVGKRFSPWKSPAQSATLRWAIAFHKLSTEMQAAIELIFSKTPLLNVSLPTDHKTSDIYLAIASVYRYSQDSTKLPSLRFIEISSKRALRAESPLPYVVELVQRCWEVKLGDMMKKAEEYAQRGLDDATLRYIEAARKLALQAGRPLPDSRALLQMCWEVKFDGIMKRAEAYARRGLEIPVLFCIEEAKESALKAGRPLPDTTGLLQHCLEVKLGCMI